MDLISGFFRSGFEPPDLVFDVFRSGDVAPKYAVAAIKKKFYSENPHVVLYALMVRPTLFLTMLSKAVVVAKR